MSTDFDAADTSEPEPPIVEASAAEQLQTALAELLARLQTREQKTEERLALLCERLVALENRLLPDQNENRVAPPAPIEQEPRPMVVERVEKPRPATKAAAKGDDWETILFGLEMAGSDSMTSLRSALVDDLRRGECTALAFLGQLLLFRSAEADRISPLLKDLGESYYAWSTPRGEAGDTQQRAFAAWLVRRCAAVGVPNVIELVHVGDRIDLARHYATGRGVEVAAVHGWVVLRDNGKVYTKATVTGR